MQRNHFAAPVTVTATVTLGLLVGMATAALPQTALAQDAAKLEALREEYESSHKGLRVEVENLGTTLQLQQKKMSQLIEEVHSLREDLERLKNRNDSAATQKALRELSEKIEEVDRKRLSDGELVKKNMREILQVVKATTTAPVRDLPPRDPPGTKPRLASPEPAPTTDGGTPSSNPGPPEKGYALKIKDGDTLSRIVSELRAQGYKTTQKQVTDANPGLNWARLKIGQTVFIPSPNTNTVPTLRGNPR